MTTTSARLRIIAQAKRRGKAEGRWEAAMEFESRLAKLEREVAELRRVAAEAPTQRIEIREGPNNSG